MDVSAVLNLWHAAFGIMLVILAVWAWTSEHKESQ